ncbi:MAG: DegT/DnrJ/EryC1/StrS aminotransferase family protein [Dehalococcoidia bacterium]|nr:DegT/DnrJ/EryC1/StrS aminotransferase family protein [Dehalococcoidia bacterium]
MDFIPLAKPFIGVEEEQEIIDTLRSGLIGTGPKTALFEQEFARYINRKRAVGIDSCTNSLHLTLVTLGVGPGDEVITTPITFVATVNSIVYTGATPVFVDVDPQTLNIYPDAIEKALTPRTKAIIPVHLYGHPCDMDAILAIAQKHNLKVVSDCAHAIEAEYKGKNVGSLGDVACYSFYATKNLATGNGGMLVTDDERLADEIVIIRDHGMSAGAWNRYYSGEFKHYQMTHLGYKCIMWDLPASLGLQQLKRIEQRHAKRLELKALYESKLQKLGDHVKIVSSTDRPVRHAHHLFPILLNGLNRDAVAAQMEAHGVGVGVHYRPVHLEPYYREKHGHHPGEYPVAEHAGENLLSLPFWPEMTEEQISIVVDSLESIIRNAKDSKI